MKKIRIKAERYNLMRGTAMFDRKPCACCGKQKHAFDLVHNLEKKHKRTQYFIVVCHGCAVRKGITSSNKPNNIGILYIFDNYDYMDDGWADHI